MKKRDSTIELIRVIACLIVVTLHASSIMPLAEHDISKEIMAVILSDGVAIFFVIAGFFMFKRQSFSIEVKKTVLNIFIPAMVVEILTEFFINKSFSIEELIRSILALSPTMNTGYLWYIFTYLELVIFWPCLRMLTKDRKVNLYAIIIGLLGVIIKDINGGWKGSYSLYESPYIFEAAVLVLIGFYIYNYYYDLLEKNKVAVRLVSLLIIILSTVFRCYWQIEMFIVDITANFWCWWYRGIAFISVTAFVVFMMTVRIRYEKLSNLISKCGECTFGIYLLHFPIMIMLKEYYLKMMPLFLKSIGIVENSWIYDLFIIAILTIILIVISLVITIVCKIAKKFILYSVKRVMNSYEKI